MEAINSLFAVITVILLFERQSSNKAQGWSYETGFATDLRMSTSVKLKPWNLPLAGPAREEIEIISIQFTGALNFNARGDLIRVVQEGQLDWAGTPTDEIDAAWQSIGDGIYTNES